MEAMSKAYFGSNYGPLTGSHRMPKFSDVWGSAEEFMKDINSQPIITPSDYKEGDLERIFYLLYAKYGNSTIAANDVNRFKFGVYTIIYSSAMPWLKKMEVQKRLYSMQESEMLKGSRQVYNTAQNPSVEPGASTEDELPYIDGQNVSINKRGVLEGYGVLMSLLRLDVTAEFLNKFKSLFLTVVYPEDELTYMQGDF